MRWDFLGRPGYPGWHIECSAIIHATLGEPIDIHTGGIDHVPVHHTNEIAQSEAAFDRKLAHYWLHCNHLTSEGKKFQKVSGMVTRFLNSKRKVIQRLTLRCGSYKDTIALNVILA